MKNAILKATVACALTVGAASSMAAPVSFSFDGTVDAVDTGPLSALVSVGDTYSLTVITDNGSANLNNQTWFNSDTISATVEAGGYTGIWSSDFFAPNQIAFMTDAAGFLTGTAGFLGASLLNGVDNFGSTANLFNDGFSDSTGNRLNTVFYARQFWNGPTSATGQLPLSGTLAMLGIGLLTLRSFRIRTTR